MRENRGGAESMRDKVDALKQAVDLRDLFMERYPGRFRRSGKWLYGSSPYRTDRRPSFAINEDIYIDFATGERGDEIAFVMREQGVNFKEAVETLQARAGGVHLSPAPQHERESPSPSEPPSAAWQTVMRAESSHAQTYLYASAPDAQAALHWLQTRGLTLDTIRRAGIGFNPTWKQTRLRERESGRAVFIAPGILIPCEIDGALWAVHVRILTDADLPKYLYVRGSKSSGLYNGDAVCAGCDVLIVEGEFDALLAGQMLGERAVVVTLGSAANKLPRRWLDRLQVARRLYSCLDNDEAGQRATAQLADRLGDRHHALKLPRGKDITDYVVRHGGNLTAWWDDQTAPFAPRPVQLPLLDTFTPPR